MGGHSSILTVQLTHVMERPEQAGAADPASRVKVGMLLTEPMAHRALLTPHCKAASRESDFFFGTTVEVLHMFFSQSL